MELQLIEQVKKMYKKNLTRPEMLKELPELNESRLEYIINRYVLGVKNPNTYRNKIIRSLKRDLKPYEIIHHINTDPRDNRIENLHKTTNIGHKQVHFSLKNLVAALIKQGIIVFDPKTETYFFKG